MNALAGAVFGAAGVLVAGACFGGGYLAGHNSAPARVVVHTVTVTKTSPPKVITKRITRTITQADNGGLQRCTDLLRDELETYALFEDDQAGYPSAANGFTPDDKICAPYVSFGTQYAMSKP